MYKIVHLTGNTYCLRCYSTCGIYDLGNSEVVLIDSCDHKKSVADLLRGLDERGWTVKAVFNTHGHVDHVYGNETIQNRFACPIYAPGADMITARHLSLEGYYFYGGTTVKRAQPIINSFGNMAGYLSDPQYEISELTADVLPENFEMICLPGHSFDMAGIKTPDGVWFLGDAVLAPETFETYHFPLFLFPNAAIRTCREILPSLSGELFVPAHTPPVEDISALAERNAEELEKMKAYVLFIADGRSFEGIFAKADEDFDLRITQDRYAKMSMMVKALISSLIEDGNLSAVFEDHRMIYRRVKV